MKTDREIFLNVAEELAVSIGLLSAVVDSVAERVLQLNSGIVYIHDNYMSDISENLVEIQHRQIKILSKIASLDKSRETQKKAALGIIAGKMSAEVKP